LNDQATLSSAPLRIACYALAAEDIGSVVSANYLMLRELLERGHEIDFFNKQSYVYPKGLFSYRNFRYIESYDAWGDRTFQAASKIPLSLAHHLGGKVTHRTFTSLVTRNMRREQLSRHYQVQLTLGTTAFGRIPGVPVISWPQGPPMTDGRSIPRHRRQIIELCGRSSYLQLRAYALWRGTFGLPAFGNSDYFITGSQWSRSGIQSYGVAADKTLALPYPIDLQEFHPGAVRPLPEEPSVLWLGRVVPRKRLDLFLDAGALLIERGVKLRIKIIGGFAFVPGYKQLIDRFKYPDRLTYQPSIERAKVRQLMHETDVILQPSEHEDFASTPAEALACGVPVVLGKTNGTADYVDDAGEIFDEYTPASVAEALEKMLSRIRQNPAETASRARAAAERHFDLHHIVDQLEGLLHRVAVKADQLSSTTA